MQRDSLGTARYRGVVTDASAAYALRYLPRQPCFVRSEDPLRPYPRPTYYLLHTPGSLYTCGRKDTKHKVS